MSGVITWITGLSAAGKTTLGVELTKRLQDQFVPVIFLDGDNLRAILGENSTHTRDDRLRLAFIYSRLCRSIAAQNVHVVISTVALFREIHVWNRQNFDNLIEVFLDVPMEELRRRDPKQIYKRFEEGNLNNVAGLDLKVDYPTDPHIHFKFEDGLSVNAMVDNILGRMKERNF